MLTPSLAMPEQVADPESPDLLPEATGFLGPKRFTWRGGWTGTAVIQCTMTNYEDHYPTMW